MHYHDMINSREKRTFRSKYGLKVGLHLPSQVVQPALHVVELIE